MTIEQNTTLKTCPGSNGIPDVICGAPVSCTAPSTYLDCLTRDERIQYLRGLVLSEWHQFKDSASDSSLLSKNELRRKHAANRLEILQRDHQWIASKAPKLLRWFANGSDLDPDKISPRLMQVESNEDRNIFRLARYTWSLPYSKGYGRRLRFLIIDDHNGKLIGVLDLQSPPLDFSPRDRKFAFAPDRKVELVNQTMESMSRVQCLHITSCWVANWLLWQRRQRKSERPIGYDMRES